MKSNLIQNANDDTLYLPILPNMQLLPPFGLNVYDVHSTLLNWSTYDVKSTFCQCLGYSHKSSSKDYCTCMPSFSSFCNEQPQKKCRINQGSKDDIIRRNKRLLLNTKGMNGRVTRLIEVLETVNVFDTFTIKGKKKSAAKTCEHSQTRSKFIGVSKNGDNWQALISIDRRKTYVGSYQEEQHAALAFDFISIITHGLTATTNFSYSKECILRMIDNYRENDGTFLPSLFVLTSHRK